MKRLLLVIPLALAALGTVLWSPQRRPPFFVSGFVETHQIRVGSRVGGRVQGVAVEEGQRVDRGEPLVTLEPFDLNERRAQARATLAARPEGVRGGRLVSRATQAGRQPSPSGAIGFHGNGHMRRWRVDHVGIT
jgi:multidrug resistance efflux pump